MNSNQPSPSPPPSASSPNNFRVLKVFNYIGATLIFLGVTFFINVNWASLSDFGKIFSTLGFAIATYLMGILLCFDKIHETAGNAFFMVSGFVLPIGLYVTFQIFNLISDVSLLNTIITAISLIVFLLSYLFSQRTIFLFFCILFGSLFFISCIDLIVHPNIGFKNLFEYELIVLGTSYAFLGYYLELDQKNTLTGPLYFFAGLFILLACFFLETPFGYYMGKLFWKILAIIIVFALSIKLQSKSFLYLGAIFTIIYIIDIISKFTDILGRYGWPLVLICIGFLLIIMSYIVFNIHKKISGEISEKKE